MKRFIFAFCEAFVPVFWMWVLIMDYLLAQQILGSATLWWLHQSMEHWYWMTGK